jgi:hypothetical protein
MTYGPTLGGYAVEEAVRRANIDPSEIDDLISEPGHHNSLPQQLEVV